MGSESQDKPNPDLRIVYHLSQLFSLGKYLYVKIKHLAVGFLFVCFVFMNTVEFGFCLSGLRFFRS